MSHFFIIKPTRCINFTNLFCHETTCFGQFLCPSSGIYSLYTQQWYMSYIPGWSCSKVVYKPVWHIPLLSVQWINSWWWTQELSETCRVSCQNKFVKLVHLVGFIIKRICHDARSHECKKKVQCLRLKELYYFIIVTGSPWWAKILVKLHHHHDGVDDNGHDADGVGETSSLRTLWNNVHSDAIWCFSVLLPQL